MYVHTFIVSLKEVIIPNIHNETKEILLDGTLNLGKEKKKEICSKRGK